MDLHPLHPSPLPREDEAPHECFNLLAAECTAIKGNLDCRNFQLQPLQVHAIRKVEDVEENLEHLTICCLKIASRMKDGNFLVHGFLIEQMEHKLKRKILQMELQIQRELKWPLPDVLSEMEFTLLRPSKIPSSLLLDAQPKMWPLLQLSQFTGAIPSSGSIHQQPNAIVDKGDLGEQVMSSEITEADAPPEPPPRLGSSGGASSSATPPSRPPVPPARNTWGASRTQGRNSDRIEPAENPITNEEYPGLVLWPYPDSALNLGSPECCCRAWVPENYCNCRCSIL